MREASVAGRLLLSSAAMFTPRPALLLLATLCACDSGSDEPTDLAALYTAAVDDAALPEASEIVDDLVAITDDNPDLMRDEDGRVLMVTWTNYDGYDSLVGQPTELGVEVWTTVAPEMQSFCRAAGLSDDALALRLEQLLGLPMATGKDRVVELWVPADAMFRPAPDPEIDDSVADLDFPASAPQDHKDWIEALRKSSYGAMGYPWTQLGYTYDWGGDGDEVGLSEFVVREGSEVVVHAVSTVAEYCGS